MSKNIKAIEPLLAGRETFAQFERRTRKDWRRVAEYLLTRYAVPRAVEVEDIVQELLLNAWREVPKFDPSRSSDPGAFVLFRAISRTKRWMHSQRRARTCRAPSNHDVSFSEAFEREPEIEVEGKQEATTEHELVLGRLLKGCRTVAESICLVAVWRIGDAEAAAIELYRDVDTRLQCRFDGKQDARRASRRALRKAKERAWQLR